MVDNADDMLDKEQDRALDVYRPVGALIHSEYLERRQEIVPVNRNDLEDLLGFDAMEAFFGGGGIFLLSGAGWLALEKVMEQTDFVLTPLIAFCGACVVFGLIFLGVAVFMRIKKRHWITRIFQETTRRSSANTPPTAG